MGKVGNVIQAIKILKRPDKYVLGHLNVIENKKIELKNGLIFYTPDKNGIHTIISTKKEYKTKGIKKGTIIDIGANIGAFSIQTAKQNKEIKVIAIEPDKKTYKYLVHNIWKNKQENQVIPIRTAISNKKGITTFEEGKGLGSRINKKGKTKVETETIENIMKEYGIKEIELLKIDCEGEEYKIIKHIKKKTLQKIKRIQMEYHDPTAELLIELINKIQEEGFKIETSQDIKKRGMIYATRRT